MRLKKAHPRSFFCNVHPTLVLALLIGMVGVFAKPLHLESVNNIKPSDLKLYAKGAKSGDLAIWPTIAASTKSLPAAFNFRPFFQSAAVITTYAGDCTTAKSLYNLQDSDLTVCAKVVGADAQQQILWSNANFVLVQSTTVGTETDFTFTLSPTSSLGDWRVILYEPYGGSVYAVAPFTVIDAANPKADLTVSKSAFTDPVSAGSQASFGIQVTNLGPDVATNVQVMDSTPANTTYSSFALISAQSGVQCAVVGNDVQCTIPMLARGETAVFSAAYEVNGGTPGGTVISNTASVSSDVPDPRSLNDSSTAVAVVTTPTAEACSLDCPANVVVTADTMQGGLPGAFVTYAAASVTGDCGAVTNNPMSGSFFTVGTHSVLSTSATGQTCSFSVTVLDTAPPTISCPPGVTRTAASGATEYTFTPPDSPGTPSFTASGSGTLTAVRSDDTAAVYDDNGNLVTPAVVHSLTDPWPIGTTGILWTVTDAGGRTASCSQTVTILEAGARDPVMISCPSNVSVATPTNSCEATISATTIGTPTTNPSDNVTVSPRRSDDRPLSDPFPAGTTNITWTATDNINGNVASCVQTVMVTVSDSGDTTPPTFIVVPQNVNTSTSTCSVILDDELGTAQATDSGACGGSVTITRTGVPPGNVFPTGTTTIIYTATDAAGNSASVVQLVTVLESPAVPPTISAPANVSVNTGPGATSCNTLVSDATLGTATASDNCPGVTIARTGVPTGNIFPVGTTIVTYRATDASGNFTEATQTVTVIDNTPPTITCPANITLEPTCPSGAIATWTPPVGTDNCPGAITTRSGGLASGSVFPIGTSTVTYTVNDAQGNSTSCSFTVRVKTAAETVQSMMSAVNALQPPLSGQQAQGLQSKLQAALDAINQGKTNVACNKLGDLISQVSSFINNGTLSSAQGQSLIDSANHVRNTIGCTALGCT